MSSLRSGHMPGRSGGSKAARRRSAVEPLEDRRLFAAVAVVNWGGDMVTVTQNLRGTAPTSTNADLDGDGAVDDSLSTYAFSTTTPLSPTTGYTGTRFYGGIRAEVLNVTGRVLADRSITNSTTVDYLNVRSQANDVGATGRFWAAVYFDKADFLNGGATQAVNFDATSSLQLTANRWEGFGSSGRWLVREGTQFYVSQGTFAGSATLGFTSDSNDGLWAPYSPTTNIDFNQATAQFTTQNFQNITGVGYLIDADALINARFWLNAQSLQVTANVGPSTPPTAASGLSATPVSATQIALSWTDNSTTETGFRVYRRAGGSTGAYTLVGTTGANVTSFTDAGLTRATSYQYVVRSFNSVGESADSNATTVSTLDTIPVAPSGLTAQAVATSQVNVNLAWTDASDNETGFIIERATDGANYVVLATTGSNATSYTDAGVSELATYYYRVRAANVVGSSGYSNVAQLTTPATVPVAPSTLAASAITATSVNLSWADNSANETGFRVYRRAGGSTGAYALVGTTGANVTSFTDTGLTRATSYQYVVRSVNSAGESGDSNATTLSTLDTIPVAPSGLAAQAVATSQVNVQLTWVDASDNETGFIIERATDGANYVVLATAGSNATSYTDAGVSELATYYYRVRATNSVGSSGYSNVAQLTTPATVPLAASGLTGTALSATQVSLSWTDNAFNETEYRVYRRAAGSTGAYTLAGTVGQGVTSFTDATLTRNTGYQFVVRAFNSAGESADSNAVTVTTPDTVPVAPSSLSATAVATSQVNVSLAWTDASDNETGFIIERSTDGVSYGVLATVGANATSYTDAGVAELTTYRYRVRAANVVGSSAYSNVATVATPATIPLAASGLSATATSATQVNLSWTDNAVNETGFQVLRSSDGGATYAVIATPAANAVSFTDTTVSSSTTYSYYVVAVNSAGSSAASNTATVTTPLAPPAAPTGLTASPASFAQVNLAWTDASSTETGYTVERSLDRVTFTVLATLPANSTSYQDTAVSPLTTYYYRVSATNAAGTGTSAIAQTATPQRSVQIVNFGGDVVTATQNLRTTPTLTVSDLDGDGASDDVTAQIPWSTTTPLTPAANYTGPRFYGGVRFQALNTATTTFADRSITNSTTADYLNVRYQANAAGVSGRGWIAVFFDKADFLNGASTTPVRFDRSSSIQLGASLWENFGATGRWLVRDGSQFYVSQQTISGSNTQSFTLNGSDGQWAPYTPSATNLDFDQSAATFTQRDFRDVTAVGFLIDRDTFATTRYWLNLQTFRVTATTGTLPAPAAPANLAANATGPTTVALIWTDTAGDTEDGFRIFRRPAGSTGAFTQVATVGQDVTTYTDTGLTKTTSYEYRVRAFNSVGDSPDSLSATVTTQDAAPLAPSALAATLQVGSQVNVQLSWTDNSDNETSFTVQRSFDGISYNNVGSVGANVTTLVNTNVPELSTISYRVLASNAVGDSPVSAVVTVTTPATIPLAPTGIAATATGPNSVQLTWTDTAFNETGYRILRSSNGGASFSQVAVTGAGTASYTDTSVAENTSYQYRVVATNSAGDSAVTNTASVTTPQTIPLAPASLSVALNGNSAVTLTWTDTAFNESQYYVERQVGSLGTWTRIATLAAGSTSYDDSALSGTTGYSYRVQATNTAGVSAYSPVAFIVTPRTATVAGVPTAPTGLTATSLAPTSVAIAWNDNSATETGFVVRRSTAGGASQVIANLGAGITSYTDSGLAEVTGYAYTVEAVNEAGASTATAPLSLTTPLSIPLAATGVTATATSPTSVQLSWTDNAFNETQYRVLRSADGGATFQLAATLPAGSTGYLDQGVAEFTTFTYQVIADNAAGSSQAATATVSTPASLPLAPSALSATPNLSGIQLDWTDNSFNETSFQIQRSTDGVSFNSVATVQPNTTTYTDVSAVPQVAYSYRVVAVNSAGSAASDVATATRTSLGSASGGPTNDPVAAAYGTRYSWTSNITWARVYNVLDFGGVPNDGQDDTAAFNAARDAVSAAGGGVVYFPSGTWNFSDTIYLTNNVVIRGADVTGITDGRQAGYDPTTNFEFPQYIPTFTGSGTPNSTAFKRITSLSPNTDSNIGLVNVDVNRGRIFLVGDGVNNTNRNVIVYGVRSNNVADASNPLTTFNGAPFQNAWQRWGNRFSTNISVQADANALVANNRVNDNVTDSYAQPGYIIRDRTTNALITLTNGSQAVFNFAEHYGISVNRSKGSYANGGNTPATEPSLFRPGIAVVDNYVYHEQRVGIIASGQGLDISRNVIRDRPGKVAYVDTTGQRTVGNSSTLENRGIDWSGWDVNIDSNDIQVYRTLLNGGPYSSVDGEGILIQEVSGGTTVNGVRITNNTVNSYIGIFKVLDVNNVLIENNYLTNGAADYGGALIYVGADTNTAPYAMNNVTIRNNTLFGNILLEGRLPGANNSVYGNTNPGGGAHIVWSLATNANIFNNTGFIVDPGN